MNKILKIDNKDNLIVALTDISKDSIVTWDGKDYLLVTDVSAKHKFTTEDLSVGDILYMYGVPIGKALSPIQKGEVITTDNVIHYAAPISLDNEAYYEWTIPNVEKWDRRTFKGYVRTDGRVGTRNYWLIMPLVFCENRNVLKLQEALSIPLGYGTVDYSNITRRLLGTENQSFKGNRVYSNIDGIRAVQVNSGCGGTDYDARSLCRILADYADHPNVSGVTVFSLGCEKAQINIFKEELREVNPTFNKPLLIYRQQEWSSEEEMMNTALEETFGYLESVNQIERVDVPLSKLKLGVKCGGSDGFSGISANPVMGIVSDRIVSLGGGSCLAEFPELCGAEGNILERCIDLADKEKFLSLMESYEKVANFEGASISDNPSPGNIKDGLITDAIKSTGAAKKAGVAPIIAVKDYGELMPDSGLSLVCTPGNDVEAVTGQVAAGANIILFSTGLGTPTGNPITPVIKIATNSKVAQKMSDMIDFDCGDVIEGVSLDKVADELLEKIIQTASGEYEVKSDELEQFDFMFWKRNTSL
ncbi:UxaA family hydrolase [Ignatzschineria sp. LJL83]